MDEHIAKWMQMVCVVPKEPLLASSIMAALLGSISR